MTGPEHYREAEILLGHADGIDTDEGWMPEPVRYWLAAAQVHATLAHAAAVAELDAYPDPHGTGSVLGRAAGTGGTDGEWAQVMTPEGTS